MTSSKHQRIFMTGAGGYCGRSITELAISEGYEVRGLSRSEASDAAIRGLGAVPVRGDLTSLSVLREESAAADIVIHLATAFNFFDGGSYDDVLPIDNAAVDALADGLAGTDKPLVCTSGTLVVAADPEGKETDEATPPHTNPVLTRGKNERHALSLAQARGVRVMVVRLAPYVYGRGGSGVRAFMEHGAKAGGVLCVDGGKNRITSVHVDDAARLYLLAAQRGRAGELYNASANTDALGKLLSWFIAAESRASAAKARKEFGWKPTRAGILEEIKDGSYKAVAEALRKGSA
ncbi:hypothetical protein QBC46DRAFT_367983 [Diplogelasinospora grovesii]|uniref:NAD-dependent epimerase/dehydratase domain-containing protein n=1 Tax=Diplogelasinospora grovesii TaxID=303347 RepID=A0AAN6MXK6_9PEZI|nr:hypothetical protein QBC46DRAFT_367983 [Diplogelasinospora grovesii]